MRNGTEGNLTAESFLLSWFCILSGLWIHNDYVRWHLRGRDAYLSYQAHRFDLFMASPRPAFITIIGALMVVGILLGIYELIAAAAAKLIISAESMSAANPQPGDFRRVDTNPFQKPQEDGDVAFRSCESNSDAHTPTILS